ncbi:MAG: hypothetical protein UX81_C0002G0038 [Parcubacteria group bacterium GW2011_GWA2_47_12]|nr:MAG: hypothetical protein UX81_C0002G0038 [Parcubacteria group bacterium GW2011_GWA2_47_12]
MKYKKLLDAELETLEKQFGAERMKEIFRACKGAGQEAMSREVLMQVLARFFTSGSRAKFFLRHPGLLFPYLLRMRGEFPKDSS